MLNVFYRVLAIGIAAFWMVMAVLILRLVFRKASNIVHRSGSKVDLLLDRYASVKFYSGNISLNIIRFAVTLSVSVNGLKVPF